MTEDRHWQLNDFLVNVFNTILRIEENSLRTGEFKDLSVNEMHIIQAVCDAAEGENTTSNTAQRLGITRGSLSVALNVLEKKGYLKRRRSPDDRRVVYLVLTEKGLAASEAHSVFHRGLINAVEHALSEDETDALIKGLGAIEQYFNNVYFKHGK